VYGGWVAPDENDVVLAYRPFALHAAQCSVDVEDEVVLQVGQGPRHATQSFTAACAIAVSAITPFWFVVSTLAA
jgi:hypothetical protein